MVILISSTFYGLAGKEEVLVFPTKSLILINCDYHFPISTTTLSMQFDLFTTQRSQQWLWKQKLKQIQWKHFVFDPKMNLDFWFAGEDLHSKKAGCWQSLGSPWTSNHLDHMAWTVKSSGLCGLHNQTMWIIWIEHQATWIIWLDQSKTFIWSFDIMRSPLSLKEVPHRILIHHHRRTPFRIQDEHRVYKY